MCPRQVSVRTVATCPQPTCLPPDRYDDMQQDSTGESIRGLVDSLAVYEPPGNCIIISGAVQVPA